MNKKRLLIAVGVSFTIAMMVYLFNPGISSAQECRIVMIKGGAAVQVREINLEPMSLTVSKGDCVVWFNRALANEVKVKFEEGKTCQNLTDAPVGFKIDEATDCYVTSWIPLGGTSSLRFVNKGVFNYTVETQGGIKQKGKIAVQ